MITAKQLRELLNYNPETGVFSWSVDLSNGIQSGDTAGSINKDGYMLIGINRRLYYAHRLAWLYIYGQFPKQCIDHINRNKSDNRIANLRSVSHGGNSINRPIQSNNRSGITGVRFDKRRDKWVAEIKSNGKYVYLGVYNNKLEAAKKRRKAEIEYGHCTYNFKTSAAEYIESCS